MAAVKSKKKPVLKTIAKPSRKAVKGSNKKVANMAAKSSAKKPVKKIVRKLVVKKAKKKPAPKKLVKRAPLPKPREVIKQKVIGRITHYFDNIGVAVVQLDSPLRIGDAIRVVGGEATDFQQKVQSMEVEHQKVAIAKKGQEVGLKIKEKVREGYKIYKI